KTQPLSFTAIDWALQLQTQKNYELAAPSTRVPGPIVTFGDNGPGWIVTPGPEFTVDLLVTLLDGSPATVRLLVASVGELPTGTPPTGTVADWIWTAPAVSIADPDLDGTTSGGYDGSNGWAGCLTTPIETSHPGEPLARSR